MGVKLQELIIRRRIDISELSGKIIAVDAPNIIMALFQHSFKGSNSRDNKFFTDRTQRAISHLSGLLYRVKFYYTKKIFPIFCFDGRDSELKYAITKDRLNDFLFTQKRYKRAIESNDKTLAKQIAMSREYLGPNILKESRELLGALSVPYIDSPASAESQCAEFVKQGIADFSNSQDFDSLLFGCPSIIQNLSKSSSRKVQGKWVYQKITPLSISLRECLKSLNINQFQLVDMGIIIGTDYFEGIEGIGPKKALELIKRHQNLEKITKMEKENYDFSKLTPGLIQKIRKIFLMPHVIKKFDTIHWNAPNIPKVIELLCEEHYLNREKIEKNVGQLSSNFTKCRNYHNNPKPTQKSLKSYF